jgi:hypothetical protein
MAILLMHHRSAARVMRGLRRRYSGTPFWISRSTEDWPNCENGGRSLNVDGGPPSGKKKSTDNLNIFYTPPRPTIVHSPATQDPVSGIVDLDYGTARFVVQYD